MTEPAWLIHLVDQRMALIEQALGSSVPDTNLIFTPLTEPRPPVTKGVYDRWDRTCDSCGEFIPQPLPYYTGHTSRTLRGGTQVFMHFGVCAKCKSSLED